MNDALTTLDHHLPVAFRQANIEAAESIAMLLNDLGYPLSPAEVHKTLPSVLQDQAMTGSEAP